MDTQHLGGGFAKADEYISVYVPSQLTKFVFKVKRVGNVGYQTIDYGALPIPANTSLPTYDGSTVTVPAAGVLPARSYTPQGYTFPLSGAFDESDMWFTPSSYRDTLTHVKMHVNPDVIRVGMEIPRGLKQYRFQRDKVVVGLDQRYGFTRGGIETVFVPELRYGFIFGNDTNMALRTNVKFEFAEYRIEMPIDPKIVYDVITGTMPSRAITLPISVYDSSIALAFKKTYGFEGFSVSNISDREATIAKFDSIIRQLTGVGE